MSAGSTALGGRWRLFVISALAALCCGLFVMPALAQADPPVVNDVFSGTNDVTPVVITFSATDPELDPITYSIVSGPDGGTLGAINQGAGTVTYTANADFAGTDSFVYQATANGDSAEATASIVVRPNTAIDSGPSGLTNDNTPTFSFSSPQTGMVFQCRVDAAAFAACPSPFTTAVLSDGAHTFNVRARAGGSGPWDNSPSSSSITVDATTPTVSLEQAPLQDDPTNSAPIEFKLGASEDLNASTPNENQTHCH